MSNALDQYQKIVADLTAITGVTTGQMFGKACLKINGKAFVSQHNDTVVFKLTSMHHEKALALAGALLWDPSGKKRLMKEWVALPAAVSGNFKTLAKAALVYVTELA